MYFMRMFDDEPCFFTFMLWHNECDDVLCASVVPKAVYNQDKLFTHTHTHTHSQRAYA